MASYSNGKYGTNTIENVGSNEYGTSRPTKGGKVKAHFKRFWWLHLINFLIGFLIVTLILVFVGMPAIAQKGINDARLTLESQVVTNPRPGVVHVRMNTTSHSKSMYHPQLDATRAALFLEDTINGKDFKPFGYINIPRVKALATATIIVDQELEIVDEEQFARYNTRVLMSENYRVALRARLGLKEGGFPKTTVDFNKVITSPGLNNLKGFEVRNISISLLPTPDGTNMRGQVFIPNPSPMTIDMGDVTQNVYVGNQLIALATIPNLVLKPGDNLVDMTSASNQAMVISLITTQFKDGNLPVTIKGNNSTKDGVDLPYFTAALKEQTLQTTLSLGAALKAVGLDLSKLSGVSSTSGTSTPPVSSSAAFITPVTFVAPVLSVFG